VVKQRAPSLFSPGHVSSASPSPARCGHKLDLLRSTPTQLGVIDTIGSAEQRANLLDFDILGVYNEELEDNHSEKNK
tara:strand:- start:7044 stop:7274 length:231 start_codon:yes stop_codon:yes gene_type:complete